MTVEEYQETYGVRLRHIQKPCDQAEKLYTAFCEHVPLLPPEKEAVWVIILDCRLVIRDVVLLSLGTESKSYLDCRLVMREVLIRDFSQFALVHNHPSGVLTPSEEDIKTSARIAEAAKIVGLTFIDHLVVADEGYHAMRDNARCGEIWK